jgi:hypothetical protein
VQTQGDLAAPVVAGWAQAQCTGPVKASLLFRFYNRQGIPQGEAGVESMTLPVNTFVTFAEAQTGVAIANPSETMPATVTITALDSAGLLLGTKSLQLPTNAHTSANVGPLLGLKDFVGSVQITSPVPIVSLSLNFEAFTATSPVFSSVPPGDLPAATPLATGH